MCLTKLRRHIEGLLNMLIFKIQSILTCVSADKNIVCVCARMLCTLFWGGVTGGLKAKFTLEWWEQVNAAGTEWQRRWCVGRGGVGLKQTPFEFRQASGGERTTQIRGFLFKASWSGFIARRTFILGHFSVFLESIFSLFLFFFY